MATAPSTARAPRPRRGAQALPDGAPLRTATPVQVDEHLASLTTLAYAAEVRLAALNDRLHQQAGDARESFQRRGRTTYGPWQMTRSQALDALQTRIETFGESTAYGLRYPEHWAATINEVRTAQADLAAAAAAMAPLNEEFVRRGGWTRAFLADTNTGGHVHSSMGCSTCNNGRERTRFNWLPQFSGHDEDQIIDAAGRRACVVCYPSERANRARQTPGVPLTEEERAAAEVEAANPTCPGSLTDNYDRATARLGYYAGNYGVCNDCGQRVTVNRSSRRMRTHRSAA